VRVPEPYNFCDGVLLAADGPVDLGGVLREVDDARAEEAARLVRMAAR